MKEQSHKDEMSAALRGDFERLRERGVALTLNPSEPEPDIERDPEPAPAQVAEHAQARSMPDVGLPEAPDTAPRRDAHSDVSGEDVAALGAPRSQSRLGRLLGR